MLAQKGTGISLLEAAHSLVAAKPSQHGNPREAVEKQECWLDQWLSALGVWHFVHAFRLVVVAALQLGPLAAQH
jgi:hypothetical protein